MPDLVGRLFDPDDLHHTWAGDVTYIPTDEGWLYLASVLDLGSRRLLGNAMSATADTDHVIDAVAMAVVTRGRAAMDGTIFHSDRGSTYTSGRYPATCADLGLAQSTGRTGLVPGLNAVAESLFASLKQELGRRRFTSRADARQAIFVWINYYTTGGCTRPVATGRPSSTNTSLPPIPNRYHHRWLHNHGVRPAGGGPHPSLGLQGWR